MRFAVMPPLLVLFLEVFTNASMDNEGVDMLGWQGDCYLFMLIGHNIDSLYRKAHKRSCKAFVKVHRGTGRVGVEKPFTGLFIHRNHTLICREVRATSTFWGSHPHSLAL